MMKLLYRMKKKTNVRIGGMQKIPMFFLDVSNKNTIFVLKLLKTSHYKYDRTGIIRTDNKQIIRGETW